MRPIRYLFGRFNVIGVYDSKDEFLWKGLSTRQMVEERGYLWGLFDLTTVGESYITGFLVKLSPQMAEEVGDLTTHVLTHAELQNRAVAKARFLLEPRTGLIAYHTSGSMIKDDHFKRHFAELFKKGHGYLFVDAEIQAVEERYRILEAIQRFERVYELTFYLHPTNPNYDRVYRRTDERLRALEAGSYSETYKARKGGGTLRIGNDQEVRAKIAMAEDGYGKATVRGEIDGEVKQVSTAQNPISVAIPHVHAQPELLLELLRDTFAKIIQRIRP
jgi:hypothetical protein